MFQLRDQVRGQHQVLNLTRGFLSFYDCTVKVDDVKALQEQVRQMARHKGFQPLRRITFEFCRFHNDGSLDALQNFFAQLSSLESISLVKNQWTNADMARVLRGAQHHKELCVVLPGGNAAHLNRHLILEACQGNPRLERLYLDFKGSQNWAEFDQSMVEALSRLQHLKLLRLDGWTLADEVFHQLVQAIRTTQLSTTLKSLHLARIRGLSSTSLTEISRLGPNHYDNNSQQQAGLNELRIGMIPSLFVASSSDSAIDFEAVFRDLGIRQVSIQESRLSSAVVQSIFRGLASRPQSEHSNSTTLGRRACGGVQDFRLKAWSFSEAEFQELLRSLPHMRLTKLDLSQGGIRVTGDPCRQLILQALQSNMCLTELDVSYRGETLNGAKCAPLAATLARNGHYQWVQALLERVPAGHAAVEQHALFRVAPDRHASNALYALLKSNRYFHQ